MDNGALYKDVSEELATTRELLIAISHPTADQVRNLSFVPVDVVDVSNGDVSEQYRSELISISCESPDI
ncbi:hypothetical protein RchiOBHm_Chr7g0209051 [Rosa chinensis]|uniref:Uncharacterized protein n=1 Tax=Rosa chinensis TaxID=74649 RepID=A0A2P6P9V2_ROSCH|nr:hypothetical protein RchiOBHm_Chr7g0209051 [Rosa chinensis]